MQKVLIVDNDPVTLRLLTNLLEQHGYTVFTASDGFEALRALKTITPDVMLVDLVMPLLSGERFCRVVRSLPSLESVPIVLLSAIAAEVPHDCRKLGANACIAKGPFGQVAELVLAVLDQIGQGQVEPLADVIHGVDKIHQRQVTKELLAYKEHLDTLVGFMSEGVLELAPDGKIIFANPAALAMAGMAEDRLFGQSLMSVVAPKDRKRCCQMLAELPFARQSTPENHPMTINGTEVTLDIFSANKDGAGVVVLLNDVSEKKRVEKVLRRQNEYLYALHETALGLLNRLDMNELLEAIIERSAQLADTEHGFIYLLQAQTGKMKMIMGRGIFKKQAQSEIEPGMGLSGKVWETGKLLWVKDYATWQGRSFITAPDGFGSVVGIPLFGGPNVIGVIGMAHVGQKEFTQNDISVLERLAELASIALDNARLYGDIRDKLAEREAADREKKQLQAQLLHAQKMEAIGTLAGGVAHDFNNILQAITGYTELLLLKQKTDEPENKDLQAIKESAQRASKLVKQLLVFSRKMDNKYEAIQLNEVILRIAKMLERTIPRMIKIEMVLENRLALVYADVTQIEQVLMNLGVNARDAMPDGGTITIKTRNASLDEAFCKIHLGAKPGEYVRMVVSDTGHGMEKEVLDHIFEPFFTTKQRDKGTGLGLATLYGIIKSHQGFIYCSSKPGKGTVFEIYLPILKSNAPQALAEERPVRNLPRGHETILLVDDEKLILNLGQEILESHGYATLKATSGEQALKTYQAHWQHIDLVILDVGMPGIGGYKCLEGLIKINSKVKTLISSGYSPTGKVKAALQTGASGFIGKPYKIAEMLHKVREILDA
jgi:PAS domain S-box-containing protein